RRVDVVAVRPHPAGLDVPAGPVRGVAVAAPDTCAQPVQRVVGDADRVVVVGEAGGGDDRAEDLLLEDAHRGVGGADGRLHVVAAGEVPAQFGAFTAGDDGGALGSADVDVGQDLLQLVVGGLRADHGLGVERVALPHRLGADGRQFQEFVVDVGLDQAARRA